MTTPTQRRNTSPVVTDLAAPSWGGPGQNTPARGQAHAARRSSHSATSLLNDVENGVIQAGAQLREKYGRSLNPENIEDLQQGERWVEMGAAQFELQQMRRDLEMAGGALDVSEKGVQQITEALDEGGFTPAERSRLMRQRAELERIIEDLKYLRKVLERQADEHALQLDRGQDAAQAEIIQNLQPSSEQYLHMRHKGTSESGIYTPTIIHQRGAISYRAAASSGFNDMNPHTGANEQRETVTNKLPMKHGQPKNRTDGQALQVDHAKLHENTSITMQATGQSAPSVSQSSMTTAA